MKPAEQTLRERLGVPADAERVLVFGESSHWDPNWLFTSEWYYRRRIRTVLGEALRMLEHEPRRVFSVESLFFLRLYWEREPERRERLRRLLEEGRMRLLGSGITTPDTTLPATEAILRDYLYGQEWLRDQGLGVEPRLAYLPDDFGCSPALPSILESLGYTMAGITRIDGMHFVGSDYRSKASFPLVSSSAELLFRELKTTDFVWRAPDGAEVLCHWNAFSYFQGDMIAHKGVVRWMGLVIGVPWRSERHVARRIRGFVDQLAPLARTPYMFCPIGCDFNSPLADLVQLLDRYNERRYPETGVWAVNAALDDYLALVDCHRDLVPALELDTNPYWMGFYASRPEIKSRCNELVRKLVLAEKLEASDDRGDSGLEADLREAWDRVVVSNHHDFITGTSPDRVWLEEQRPMLEAAEMYAQAALDRAAAGLDAPAAPRPAGRPIAWRLEGGRLNVDTEHYGATLDERAGGCFTAWRPAGNARSLLVGPGNDLVAYHDSGGLWRMGHEYLGGSFREVSRASDQWARIEADERDGVLEVRVISRLEESRFVRWLWFRPDSSVVRMRVVGAAAHRLTITCSFPIALAVRDLVMDVPGGVAVRPREKLFDPTFWAARSWVHACESRSGLGAVVCLGGPASLSLGRSGALEWVALRNAPLERAFRVLPIPAHPAAGRDPDCHALDYAVGFTSSGDWRDNRLPRLARQVLSPSWQASGEPDLERLADRGFEIDRDGVRVTAVKRADRGEGLIIRLRSDAEKAIEARLRPGAGEVRAAWLCDARERDLCELPLEHGAVVVPLDRALTTVRVVRRAPSRGR